jgi:hypothetical protein
MTLRSRPAALLGAAFSLFLAAPAAAETLTVQPDGGACTRGADNVCGSIQQAVGQAAAADTIDIKAGTFPESPQIPAGKDGLIVKGVAGQTKITGSGTGDVLSVASGNVTVSGLSIEVPADAQSALASSGANATYSLLTITRAAGGNEPAVDLTGAGPARFERSVVVQQAGAGTAGIRSAATGGLVLVDSLVVSTKGDGVALTASTANRFIRSTIATVAAGAVATRLTSAATGSTTAKKLATESSVLIGTAAGIRAETLGTGIPAPNSTAGDLSLEIRHSTVRGAEGIQVDASAANGSLIGPAIGSIAGVVDSSIVHGPSSVKANTGSAGGASKANTATLTMSRSDAPPSPAYACTDCSNTPDDQLFAPNSSNLRADAPVIDKGGPLAPDESDKDLNGDARISDGNQDGAAAADIGADEFVNKKPVAALKATSGEVPAKAKIGFGSVSIDPEANAGGGIKEYRWDFGDGKSETTTTNFVIHTYDTPGTYQARLTVVDRQGAVSDPSAALPVKVVAETDSTPPVVTITKPANNAKITVTRKTKKGATPKPPVRVTFRGTVADATGTKQVELAIRLVKRKKGTTAKCTWLSGKTFIKASCDKPVWQKTGRSKGAWSQRTPAGLKLPPGTYEVRVRGIDLFGNTSTVFTTAAKSLIKLTLR